MDSHGRGTPGAPPLAVIQATHASLDGMRASGVLARHARTLRAYAETFDVEVYTADTTDFSREIGVPHRPVPWLPRTPGLRHGAFYLWLVLNARHMRGTIRVFGSNIPTLPLVKALSKARLVVSHQFDYAALAAQTHGAGSVCARVAQIAEWLGLRSANVVLVTTPGLGAEVERKYRLPTVLLPNWVDVSGVQAPPEGRTPGSILYAGRLHRIKGVDVLIDAFAGISEAYPEATLTLCGSGEEEQALRSGVPERDRSRVTFTGRLENEDVLRRMARTEIFVLPTTTSEGHPKALLEAMASGMACVASDVPGNRDALEAGLTGVLVPAGDAAALADALRGLMVDDSQRTRLGVAAVRAVEGLSFASLVTRDIDCLLASRERRSLACRLIERDHRADVDSLTFEAMDAPPVTIVVPSLNHGPFIREALDSILRQGYEPLECRVIDGGSTDGSVDILESYGDRIHWVSEPDRGLYDAVNKGWGVARGEWLGWVNCDDKLCPGAVARLMEAALAAPEGADLVYGDYYRFAADGRVLEEFRCGAPDAEKMVRNGNSIFIGAALVRRDFVDRIGAFDLRYPLAADYDFLLRAVTHGRVVHVPAPVSMFRMHEDSKSQNSRWQMWTETMAISEAYSGRRHPWLRARYLMDRGLHLAIPDTLLWNRSLVPVRRALRGLWAGR